MAAFKLYPEAENDLEEVWQYTVETWSVSQAIKYIGDLDTAFQLLADNPLLCRERPELTIPVRIHHVQHHLIVYTQIKEGVGIIRVLHESMDYESLLSEGNA